MQTRRGWWAEQVRQWRQSGLTAREFAQRVGVNAGTLQHWAWRLGRDRVAPDERGPLTHAVSCARFVEVVTGAVDDRRFELELGDGRRLRIPAQFDRASLEQLLAVLAKPAR